MIDIPGLIEGAHAGKGMGKEFLRHVERCRVLLYLVDVTLRDPATSYATLRNELLRYDPMLLEKPSVLALTKCDLIEGGTRGVDPGLLGIHSQGLSDFGGDEGGDRDAARGALDGVGLIQEGGGVCGAVVLIRSSR